MQELTTDETGHIVVPVEYEKDWSVYASEDQEDEDVETNDDED